MSGSVICCDRVSRGYFFGFPLQLSRPALRAAYVVLYAAPLPCNQPTRLPPHVCHPAQVPDLFQWLQATGNVPLDDMRRTFNMGVGMIIVVDPSTVDACKRVCPELFYLGEVVQGDGVKFV